MLESAALPSVIRGGGWHITMETAALQQIWELDSVLIVKAVSLRQQAIHSSSPVVTEMCAGAVQGGLLPPTWQLFSFHNI